MALSKSGERFQRYLQRLLHTSEDLDWDVEKESPDQRKGIIVVSVGKPKMLTDMDWDVAINEPSRLAHAPYREPYNPKKFRVSLRLDENGDIIKAKILKLKKVI